MTNRTPCGAERVRAAVRTRTVTSTGGRDTSLVDGSDATDLLVDDLAPQATTIVQALRAFEDAELRMRSRIRSRLGLGTTDLAALRYIRSRGGLGDPARGTDLRPRRRVSPPAPPTIPTRLPAAGSIEKPRAPADGRARKLSLTAYAHERI